MTDTPASAPQNDPAEEYLTDHSYDGIQEYDNPLPGWWKALFWGSIGFSVLYWAWYQAGPGKGVFERYEASVVAAEEAKAERQRERLAGMELKPDSAAVSSLASRATPRSTVYKAVIIDYCRLSTNGAKNVYGLPIIAVYCRLLPFIVYLA